PALVDRALAGERVVIERVATHYVETGAKAWWELSLLPIHGANGEVTGVMGLALDSSLAHSATNALAQKERELKHAMKMEAVGRIAGGVAHDFNNILTAILSFSRFAAAELSPESPVREDIDEVISAAERAATLTRQLLLFSRGGRRESEPPVPVDLATVVRDVQKMLARVLGEDITLSVVSQPNLPQVLVSPSELEEVLMNLAVNARDAMPRGGALTIRVSHEAGSVILTVSDTGTGIPPEIRARIFDPFFTTKDAGKGTGLGLSVVRDVVQRAGGKIEVDSTLGVGTTFRVSLAAISAATATAGSPTAARVSPPTHDVHLGAGRVALVVEDDACVRAVAVRQLRQLGFTVVEASEAHSACAAITHEPRIDLLLSDIVMPGFPGTELAAVVRSKFPRAHVLFMSGYAADRLSELGIEEGEVLTKPYRFADLLSRIETAFAIAPSGEAKDTTH
ncbi:MAG TPA: ATP-binding protein, partial [bacterium]|nr:ATP-binding protein [bacterium]